MKGSRLLKALLAAMLAVFAASAQAATYYVDCDDPTAKDADNQDATKEATPWKTLYWAGFKAQPGDTVLVKDGVCPDPEDVYGDKYQVAYFGQDGETARKDGKPYWTTFKAYPGHHPHIRFKVRQGEPAKGGIHIVGSYIIVDGFEVSPEDYPHGDYGSGSGIYVTEGHHSIVRNCNVHDCPNSGIGSAWVDYITIENNIVWNNARHSCQNSSGIGFYQPHGSDIDFGATRVNGTDYRIVIANNRIYLNEAEINTCVPTAVDWPTDGNGIILDDFGSRQVYEDSPEWMKAYKDKLYPHRTLIMNNLIYGNGGRGILSDAAHVDVLHNTVYSNLQSQPLREHCGALGEIALHGFDTRVFNNIATAQHKAALWLKYEYPFPNEVPTPKTVYGSNLIYGGGTDTDDNATDAGGNIVQDPLLAAPGLNADSDFHLTQDSPAINKGSAENSAPLDFDGFARPIGILPDIGAYEAMSDTAKTVNPANGHSYQRFSSPLTWSEAKAACAALGGYLATVTSPEEQKYVTSKGANAWLGATDEVQDGTWRWITGEPCNWTNWNSGEPNECDGGEDFLQLWPNGTWNDNGGPGGGKDATLPYICEWNGRSSAPWLPAMYQFLLKGK
ncbi:lectin-like protein [Candidatus Electronema sp. TJ]|uniref:lectin-like protein n=1 Tax=Candidatus Electronema sp. TJ TaxID=3401573 RepID=UPI003AA88C33